MTPLEKSRLDLVTSSQRSINRRLGSDRPQKRAGTASGSTPPLIWMMLLMETADEITVEWVVITT
ncbi:hypothetical protein D9M71_292460 [compost metagenome]